MPADILLLLIALVCFIGTIYALRGANWLRDDEVSKQGQMPGEIGFGDAFTRFCNPLFDGVAKWPRQRRKLR